MVTVAFRDMLAVMIVESHNIPPRIVPVIDKALWPYDKDRPYPDLHFGFNFTQSLLQGQQPIASQGSVTLEAFRALNAAIIYDLAEPFPGIPADLDYHYSEDKVRRFDSRLSEWVSRSAHPKAERKQRRDIVDVACAVDTIVDELARYNHPVGQMVMQLYNEYGERIGDTPLQYTTTEIIKQTHSAAIQTQLNKQVDAWRLGGMSIGSKFKRKNR